jgi:hypothetical protein
MLRTNSEASPSHFRGPTSTPQPSPDRLITRTPQPSVPHSAHLQSAESMPGTVYAVGALKLASAEGLGKGLSL